MSDEHTDILRLLEQRQRQASEELAALDRFGRAIHNPDNHTALFHQVYEEASQLMPVEMFVVALLMPNGTHLQPQLMLDQGIEAEAQAPLPFHPEGPIGAVIQACQPVVLDNAASDFAERFPAASSNLGLIFHDSRMAAWMAVPILRYSEAMGVIIVQSSQEAAYGPREERLLTTFAGMVAIALAQGELLGQLTNTRMALSVPLIPLSDTHLLLTLVGVLDSERTNLIQETLLHTIQGSRYRIVLISLVAVQSFDDAGLAAMVKMTRAVELLGARCVLAGISPDFSLKLVDAGADLNRLQVFPSLLRALQSLRLAA